MAINIFDSIKSAWSAISGGLSSYNNYMEWLWSKAYDYANTPTQKEDVIQKFLDDSSIDSNKKRAMLQSLKDGVDENEVRNHLATKYYPETQAQFHETLPSAPLMTGSKWPMLWVQTAVNFIPSLYNTAAWLFNTASTAVQEWVWNTANLMAKWAIQSAWNIAQNVQQTYQNKWALHGTSDLLASLNESISTHPVEYASTFAPKATFWVAKDLSKPLVQGIKTGAKATGEQLSKVTWVAKKLSPDLKWMYSESISGLSKSEQAGLQSNPFQQAEFSQMVKRTKAPEGIDNIKNYQTERYGKVTEEVIKKLDEMQKNFSEDWKVYSELRSLPTKVESQPILQSIEQHPLLTVDKKWNIIRKWGVESGTITDADISHINRIYQDIKSTSDTNGWFLTVPQLLKTRSTASKFARYDKMDVNTLSSDGASIMRDIRGNVDKVGKERIPGLKELDSLYVDKMTELNDALRDLIYKGWDVKWEYRSNLWSIISNLSNPSRANLLARLEQIMPWLGSRVESIRNLSTLHKAMNDKGMFERYSGAGWAVVGATSLGTMFPVVWHIAWFFWGGILGRIIEWWVTKWKVKILENILSKETPSRQAEIKNISDAIKAGKEIDAKWKVIIESIKKKIIDEKARNLVYPDDNTLLLPSDTGKSTGAKNFRVNQEFAKNPEQNIMWKQTWVRQTSMQGLSSNVKLQNGTTLNNNSDISSNSSIRTPVKTPLKPSKKLIPKK